MTGATVRRIFVSLGMTDIGGITAKVLRAVLAADLNAEITVAVGARAKSMSELQQLATRDNRVRLHLDSSETCALMAAADIAVGAAGTTSWERCCLGLPTLLLVLAGNQSLIARNLAGLGAVRLSADTDPSSVTECLRHLANDPTARIAMSMAAARICDGKGATRFSRLLADAIRARRQLPAAAAGQIHQPGDRRERESR